MQLELISEVVHILWPLIKNTSDVREFGVYAQDMKELLDWLLENNVKTVAMESTGSYWQNLYAELQNSSIEVILTNGKFTKNIKEKKQMCWIVCGFKSCIL